MSGVHILHDINELSRIMPLAIINNNHKISEDYKYNGTNLSKHTSNWVSDKLKLIYS